MNKRDCWDDDQGPPWRNRFADRPHAVTEWQFRPGTQDWRRIGRKFAFGFVIFLLFVISIVWALFSLIGYAFSSWSASLVLLPIAAVLLMVLVARSGLRTWRPVRRLIDAAGRLADGDYSVRVAPTGAASSRRVVQSFNEMARRLESADEQRRRLLADLGHELRTPLTVIRGEIEAIADGVHEPDPEHLEQLLDEVVVMERLLEDLRTLSMAEAGALALHVEPTDLAPLVADTVDSHRRMADTQAVAVSVNAEDLGEVLVDPVRIREVVSNLVVNALRAMPDGGALRVSVRRNAGQVVIRVADTGSGIPHEEVDQIFERFAKGSTSAGSGLGLTISRDLVEAHGGLISVESEVAIGTTVEVRLPLRRPAH